MSCQEQAYLDKAAMQDGGQLVDRRSRVMRVLSVGGCGITQQISGVQVAVILSFTETTVAEP